MTKPVNGAIFKLSQRYKFKGFITVLLIYFNFFKSSVTDSKIIEIILGMFMDTIFDVRVRSCL